MQSVLISMQLKRAWRSVCVCVFERGRGEEQQQRAAFNQTRQPAETAAVAEPEDVQVS